MARAVISKTKMLLLSSCRETSRPLRCHFSSSCRETSRPLRCHFSSSTAEHRPEKSGNPIERSKMEDWLPHPRTGIYVPKGHDEWVMEDVPENAASFSQTYWLRNVDGVEKPIHCLATNLYPASQEGLDQVLACCDDN
ncbi:GLUTAMATE RACEMASE [Salix purpurea]|uniref:GLUTAMATE RACEMASE n=1 Tax=Salix purpurea TaxID=77065 RepID=A0A9Q0VUA4_SALPP|nr:GLUTAMATE RACEMASE [Salix purpurea]